MFNARMKGSGKAKSVADFGRFVAAAAVEADDGGKTVEFGCAPVCFVRSR